VIKKMQ